MAEFVMKDLLEKTGREYEFEISSAATSTEEIWNGIGNPIYPPAKEMLLRHGIRVDAHRAVQLKKEDYQKYDLLIGMDDANIRNMHRMLGGDPDGKICKLLSFCGEGEDVADPWYSDNFDLAYRDIERGCRALLHHLKTKNNI